MDEKFSTTQEIIKAFLDLIHDQDHSHFIWSRALSAFWGSTVFHFALLSNKSGNLSPGLDKILEVVGYEELSIIIILYSLTFGFTVAVSKPKSSLVRHFVYGALLPAVAYALAGRF